MPAFIVEPIELGRHDLAQILAEIVQEASNQLGTRQARALAKIWKALIEKGSGFILINDGKCTGIILYTAEYELRFSSFLSESSARKLPQNITICLCCTIRGKTSWKREQETLLLKTAISRLRMEPSVETIAVQCPPLYRADIEGILSAIGFMNCHRIRMQRSLSGRISAGGGPPGSRFEVPTENDADQLGGIIYHGYFSEIDGYLFPDISAVCSDSDLFKEFITNRSIHLPASILARVQGHPSGCVISLAGDAPSSGLIGIVAVVPEMRRRGVGKAMLLRVLRNYQEIGYERASLAVTVENTPAVSLYESIGFQEASRRTNISVWRRSVSRPLMNFRR
ncbi:MAG: GNAT family N-acetyltransferase [Candidatus Abyssobacteria bacterium SURF_5]|uniref:GNAT family N-acetyltransferase n=1 Tax=Abyssobacteria bacterium (strain SURF_5) TaxID=2093360 RepID=A0A3A4NXN5_ABYX5|nr:MAG: GNAT family N-acetyltransferase [Candidatus Abyssubacteria bacterium SURF_5]